MFLKRKRPPDKRFSESAEPVLLIIFVMRGRSGGGSAPYFFLRQDNHRITKITNQTIISKDIPTFLRSFCVDLTTQYWVWPI